MSRSHRSTPISSWCSVNAGSQRWFRESENRAKRHCVRQLLHTGKYDTLPHDKEYGNEWDSPRDGKMYFGDMLHKPCGGCRWFGGYGSKCTCDEREKDFKEYLRK